jgi:hypothetical protein
VTSVSSPEWTDDELLRELRAALQESPVDESVLRAAEAAFTWRTVDTELELLSQDTVGWDAASPDAASWDMLSQDTVGWDAASRDAASPDAALDGTFPQGILPGMLPESMLVRGSGPDAPRTLVFHGDRLSVEVEIDEDGIVGQLMPPRPGVVTLVTAAGPQATAQADEVGCFTFPLPAAGPLRLDCRLGTDHFITDWVTV